MYKAKYKVTYNPYYQEIKLEEYTNGNPAWEQIGKNSKNVALSNVIGKGKVLRQVVDDLLKAIENIGDPNSIQVCFSGTEKDYNIFQSKFSYYINHSKNSKYEEKVEFLERWKHSKEIDNILNQFCEQIRNKFSEEPDISEQFDKLREVEKSKTAINILVTGEQNVGKSTFINALIGQQLLPMSQKVETANIYRLKRSRTAYIKFINSDKELGYIDCETGKYEEITSDINQFLDNIDCVDYKKQADCIKEINNICKLYQEENKLIPFDEVIIGVKDLKIGNSNCNFVITDVPGSDAKGYGKKHDDILKKAAQDAINTLIIYIYSSGTISQNGPQELLKKLKVVSDRHQIDWANAIFIINKAGELEDNDFRDLQNMKKHDDSFSYCNLIMVDSRAALYIKTNDEKFARSSRIKFTTSSQESSLYKVSVLPDDEKEDFVNIMESIKGDDGSNTDCLVNTGIPLVECIIDRYVSESFEDHSIISYDSIMQNMLEIIKETINKKENLEKQQQEQLEERRQITKNKLRSGCDKIHEEWEQIFRDENPEIGEKNKEKKNAAHMDSVINKFRQNSRLFISELSKQLPDKVECFRAESEQLLEQYKKSSKDNKDKKPFKTYEYLMKKLENYINNFFEECWPKLTKDTENIADEEIEKLRQMICENLDLRDLNEEERENIKNKILKFKLTKPITIDFDKFDEKSKKRIKKATKTSNEIELGIGLGSSGMGIALAILSFLLPYSLPVALISIMSVIFDGIGITTNVRYQSKDKQNKDIVEQMEKIIDYFYMRDVVPKCSNKLIDYIYGQGKELKEYCKKNIDMLSIELIEEQKNIDKIREKIADLQDKRIEAEQIIKEKDIVMRRE